MTGVSQSFEDDEDRLKFLGVLAEVVNRFNWLCHAWCLMTNHYHLVVETPDGNLSKGMRQLNGMVTQASNRRHQRTGHLFQGRFKEILVNKDSHMLELTRSGDGGRGADSPLARERCVTWAVWQAPLGSTATLPPVRA